MESGYEGRRIMSSGISYASIELEQSLEAKLMTRTLLLFERSWKFYRHTVKAA